MDGVVPAGERLRASVLRVRGDGEGLLGTAFAIAPELVLTAAHVVPDLHGGFYRLDGEGLAQPLEVLETRPAPNANHCDLALLRVSGADARILPCAAAPPDMAPLVARGFGPAAPGGRELRFEPRGHGVARYGEYNIEVAFELVGERDGDRPEGGFSGAPLMDVGAGVVLGVLSGGDPARGTSWAIPLAEAAAGWSELAEALAWNGRHVPRFGRLVNAAGARLACAAASAAAVDRMHRSGKFAPERHVPREVNTSLLAFVGQTERPVLAVVGGANTGKSWLMCDCAREQTSARLLLFAWRLPASDPPDLAAFASEALCAAWPKGDGVAHGGPHNDLPDAPRAEAVATALCAEGEELLVLLDGLNEAFGVPHLLRHWLPEAVAWIRGRGAKLIFTTRPERWPVMLRAVPDIANVLFEPVAAEVMGHGRTTRAEEQYALRLGDFSSAEAVQALHAYGLGAELDAALGHHPLMFRIAAELRLTEGAGDAGRYRLIDNFVDRHVDEASERLQRGTPTTLRARVRELAGQLPEDGSGAVAIHVARGVVGDDATLDALIATGLLIEAGGAQGPRAEAVRFTFDQVAEAMAPAPPRAEVLFGPQADDGPALRRDAAALLRLEADDNAAAYGTGLGRLLGRLRELGAAGEGEGEALLDSVLPLAEAATYVAGALPPRRSGDVDAIFVALASCADAIGKLWAFEDLVNWIAYAPLPAARRAALLVEIAPWSEAWPLRFKDWAHEDRRPSFEHAVESDGYRVPLATRLNALLRDHCDEVRPVLLRALGDQRRIDKGRSHDSRGEAEVSSMAGGLLFHRRSDDFAGLVRLLLASQDDMARHLLGVIAESDPLALCDLVLPVLRASPPPPQAVLTLEVMGRKLDPARRQEASRVLETLLAAGGEVAARAARALLSFDPGHLGAWDQVAQSIAAGKLHEHLPSVPPERFEQALDLARRFPAQCLGWMSSCDLPELQQEQMAQSVAEVFRRGEALSSVLWVVENKVHGFARTGRENLRPWMPLARELAQGDASSRECIIVSVFYRAHFMARPELADLAELLAHRADREEVREIARRLIEAAEARQDVAWLPLFMRVRRRDAAVADEAAALAVAGCAVELERLGRELLGYWQSLPPAALSGLAAELLARWTVGTDLQELFSSFFIYDVLRKIARDRPQA